MEQGKVMKKAEVVKFKVKQESLKRARKMTAFMLMCYLNDNFNGGVYFKNIMIAYIILKITVKK